MTPEQQPYEKHLSEQLNNLSSPASVQKHWEQMKQLLDTEMPVTPKSPFKWWWIGGLAVLIVGLSLYLIRNQSSNPSVSKLIDSETKQQSASVPTETRTSKKASSPVENNSPTTTAENQAVKSKELTAPLIAEGTATPAGKPAVDETRPAAPSSNRIEDETASEFSPSKDNKRYKESNRRNVSVASNNVAENAPASKRATLVERKSKASGAFVSKVLSSSADRNNKLEEKNIDNIIEPSSISPVAANISDVMRSEAMVHVQARPKLIPNYAFPNLTATAMFKPRSRFKFETERTKSLRNRVVGTGDHKKYAFGISVPLMMPISDQRALGLNFNAGENKIGDYLPSIYGQYHLNDKSFIQAEIQILSPQYIAPTLLSVTKVETGTAQASTLRWRYTYTTAQKLYYFNLPISAYYSPFKNFYLGAGLQFSQLMRGVASVDVRSQNPLSSMSGDSAVSFKYVSFGNDSIGSKLNRTDARVLIDANYYWNKFSFGVRYNQSFNNYVNLQPASNSPYTIARNKTLYFYLRYNLFETYYNKKKK